MKLIYLSAFATIPNESGERKIEKANKREDNPINYSSLGIKPPKDEVEYDEEGRIILDDNDFEEITLPLTIPVDNLGSWVANANGGTTVYTKNNVIYDVEEEVWEIDTYLGYLNKSRMEKFYLSFLSFLRKIKWKLQGKKKVDLQELLSRPENQPDYKQE